MYRVLFLLFCYVCISHSAALRADNAEREHSERDGPVMIMSDEAFPISDPQWISTTDCSAATEPTKAHIHQDDKEWYFYNCGSFPVQPVFRFKTHGHQTVSHVYVKDECVYPKQKWHLEWTKTSSHIEPVLSRVSPCNKGLAGGFKFMRAPVKPDHEVNPGTHFKKLKTKEKTSKNANKGGKALF